MPPTSTDSTPDEPAASHSDDDHTLPVPVNDVRKYIQVTPTDSPLQDGSPGTQFKRLHRIDTEPSPTGLLDKLRRFTRDDPAPTIECLLHTDGSANQSLSYWFGVDDPEATSTLERILRGVFPDSYEFEHLAVHPGELEAILTGQSSNTRYTDWESLRAIEFTGRPERRSDWQTSLTPFESFQEEDERLPLAAIVETMAAHPGPLVYQALLQPKPDWSKQAEQRRLDIETHSDTLGAELTNTIFGAPDPETDISLSASDETRLEELQAKDARHSFVVNARVVGVMPEDQPDATATFRELDAAFSPLDRTTYEIDSRSHVGQDAEKVAIDLLTRTVHPPAHGGLRSRIPGSDTSSRGIVADPSEAPSFCLVDGPTLPTAGARAISTTPGERTALPRPPADQLARYQSDGLVLGHPLTQDGSTDPDVLKLPPTLQPMHVGWFGKTGSGKSTSLINAILDNHAATDGADILIDPKGDGMAIEYLRAHYARHGHVENVLYFDCTDVLPAFSFFDIRDELDAGVPRDTAVEDTVDHYVEILMQIMGRERFEQAVRSPDIIRYVLKAMFDPVHGDDAFSHREFHGEIRTMHDRESVHPVSDADLERMLSGLLNNRARTFDKLMSGVSNRIEKIPVDRRLAKIFNHVPEEGDPHFDLASHLDENVVIIFDTGGLRSEAQRVLSLVVLSNLWTALRRRSQRGSGSVERGRPEDTAGEESADVPLVNLYVEEAASVAVSDLLKELLAQSRSFGCSVTLAMQFPAQLKEHEDVYDEILNNISTFVTGNVPVDRRLAERLATEGMDAREVGNRLRALSRGEWLVSLPAPFDKVEPRPFLVRSVAPPPGDPDGPQPLSTRERETFESRLAAVQARTNETSGLALTSPQTTDSDDEEDGQGDANAVDATHVVTPLRTTRRMPPTVEYDDVIHALRCTECDNRYNPHIEGMKRAIECCDSLEDVERDDVPICEVNLKLTPEERQDAAYSDTQLMFLQAVYNAQQLRYDAFAYDLLSDSMIRLQEYVGIETDAVDALLEADLLRHDTDHPHRVYTVTPDGRSLIGESYRLGVDYGHGKGDLEESSQHVLAVEVARRYLCHEYLENPDSSVVEVMPYYDLDEVTLPASVFMGGDEADVEEANSAYDKRRLDVAALDEDGQVIVAVEVERINNDVHRAVPDDFDKIADCGVEEAIWVVMKQRDGHKVLSALNDPVEGDPRVEKTYAETTPPQQFRIDTPGLTAVYPVEWLRDSFEAE